MATDLKCMQKVNAGFVTNAQADLRLCWSHIPHCWKSHVAAQLYGPTALIQR